MGSSGRHGLALLTFMVVIGAFSTATAGVFTEDFEDGSLSSAWWTEGTYAVNNGVLEMVDGTNTWLRLRLINELVNSFDADIKLGDTNQIAGIVLQWWPTNISSTDWEVYQLSLKIVSLDSQSSTFQASLGYETPTTRQLIGQVNLGSAARQQWYSLSIALAGDHVVFAIDGTEFPLFHNQYPKPVRFKMGECMVHGHDSSDISYFTDNLSAITNKLGDFGPDSDVDGSDLATYISSQQGIPLADFASVFGSN
jgi:hypothetical protein